MWIVAGNGFRAAQNGHCLCSLLQGCRHVQCPFITANRRNCKALTLTHPGALPTIAAPMQQPFTPPEFQSTAFHCPYCNAYADQRWSRAVSQWGSSGDISFCECGHCKQLSIWKEGRMIYPDSSAAPLPNPDLPEDIKTDYEEARAIISRSPRGACALLRLCVQA